MSTDLRCPACGRTYADRWRCVCGHPLDFTERPLPDGPPPAFTDLDIRDGLWTFADFLPVTERVRLGGGWTPLVSAPDWGVSFKLEYVSPTGSFKDRGAAVVVSRAAELGIERVVEDSSGNAGAAVATYAARADIDAEIYVPADVKESKLRASERTGANVVRVEGTREEVTAAAIETIEAGAGWYASHAWRPSFYAGTQTFAFEVAAQCDWQVPDAVVLPIGHGTLFLGTCRGFRALREAGWTDEIPRLLGAQATGYAPIAAEDSSGEQNDRADGIHIHEPVRKNEIIRAIEETGGDAIAIDADATERERDRLRKSGFHVEPTSAVAPAALREYRARGIVDENDQIVVPLTGSNT